MLNERNLSVIISLSITSADRNQASRRIIRLDTSNINVDRGKGIIVEEICAVNRNRICVIDGNRNATKSEIADILKMNVSKICRRWIPISIYNARIGRRGSSVI